VRFVSSFFAPLLLSFFASASSASALRFALLDSTGV